MSTITPPDKRKIPYRPKVRQRKTARNSEITKRIMAGDSGTALAREYGISRSRIYQIVKAYSERET